MSFRPLFHCLTCHPSICSSPPPLLALLNLIIILLRPPPPSSVLLALPPPPPSYLASSPPASKNAKWRSQSAKTTIKDFFAGGASPKFLKGLKGGGIFVNCILVDAAYARILVTPDNLTPLLRVAWDLPNPPGSTAAADAEMLSMQDSLWLRRIAYSGWKDLKLHFAELETLRCRGEAAGLGPNLFPVFEKRLAILKSIIQMQQLLGGLARDDFVVFRTFFHSYILMYNHIVSCVLYCKCKQF